MIPIAAAILTACGAALVLIGVFFLVARPPLLPEDARFIGSTVEHIADALPALGIWLRRVFWVLGGYIATTGLLVVYVANTGVRTGSTGALVVAAVAGVTSIGWMTAANFMIRSNFRWMLLGRIPVGRSGSTTPGSATAAPTTACCARSARHTPMPSAMANGVRP